MSRKIINRMLFLAVLVALTPLAAQEAAYAPGDRALSLFGEWLKGPAGSSAAELAASGDQVLVIHRATHNHPTRPASELQAATYLRRLSLSSQEARPYALLLSPVEGIASIRVNGELVYEGGAAERSANLRFSAGGPTLDILVTTDPAAPGAVDFERGDLTSRLFLFGDPRRVDQAGDLAASVAFLRVGFFVLLAFLTGVLFVAWRKNRDFLLFSLFALASAALQFVKNGAFLPFDFPSGDLALHLALAFQYASLALFVGLVLERIPRAVTLAATMLPLAAGLLPALAPSTLRWAEAAIITVGAAFMLGTLLLSAVRAFKPGDGRARLNAVTLAFALAFALASVAVPHLLADPFEVALYAEPAGFGLFSLLCLLILFAKIGTAFEEQESLNAYVEDVTKSLRRFIPTEFLEALEKEKIVDVKLGDHVKKDMTIFFSDIRAFTELSERLTVEENFAFINSYLSRVVPLVTEHGGFVDKYIGDAIMALFSSQKGPEQAIRAAIAMQKVILEYNGHRAKMGYVPIQMGVGIHTGSLMLGVVGVEDRMENTVISDAVNLSSRLQAIAKLFNIGILVSEATFKALEDPGAYTIRFMGKVRVKGKEAPVSTFEILDGLDPELLEKKTKANTFFEQGMIAYYQKDYGNAMYFFKRVIDAVPQDGAAIFYLEQCIIRADRGKAPVVG